MAGERILLVEDDEDIREVVGLNLRQEGFVVHVAANGQVAVEMASKVEPDIVLLDILLPLMDGYEVCQELRKRWSMPIIFLSCKGADEDKIVGLTIGGDDYLTKPFSMGELMARIRAHLRRRRQISPTSQNHEDILRYPGLVIDFNQHSAQVDGSEIELTSKEFEILALLAKNPKVVFSAEHIFRSVWGTESYGDHRTTMVHISNLRKKIETDPANPRFIHTLKGVGYKFSPSSC